MPKRRNPYGECVPREAKLHVGFRERATEEEKKAVCGEPSCCLGFQTLFSSHLGASFSVSTAKTVALLFQGANPGVKIPHSISKQANGTSNGVRLNGGHHNTGFSHSSNGHSSPGLRQCSGGSGVAGGGEGVRRGEGCCSCRGRPAGRSVCGGCEGGVCEGCVRQCSRCGQLFCSLCSVLK